MTNNTNRLGTNDSRQLWAQRTWSSKTVDDKQTLVQGRQKDHLIATTCNGRRVTWCDVKVYIFFNIDTSCNSVSKISTNLPYFEIFQLSTTGCSWSSYQASYEELCQDIILVVEIRVWSCSGANLCMEGYLLSDLFQSRSGTWSFFHTQELVFGQEHEADGEATSGRIHLCCWFSAKHIITWDLHPPCGVCPYESYHLSTTKMCVSIQESNVLWQCM